MNKLISVTQGIILIDTEAEIKENDYVYDTFANNNFIWQVGSGDLNNQNLTMS